MSRRELPVSLLDRVLGGGPRPPDEATVDRVQRAMRRLDPDPLYRRRLRGSIVNYHVASREGHLRRRGRPRRHMTAIGRSVLYASVALALGVTAVGAVAHESLPGDALYGVKLRLEEVRMQIAPPSVRSQLASIALAERIDELEQLAAAGTWERVPTAADRVAAAEAMLPVEPDGPLTPMGATSAQAVEVLQAVLAEAPAAARPGLENALQASTGRASAGAAGSAADPADAASGAASPPAVQAGHPPQAQDGDGAKTRAENTGKRRASRAN